MALRTTRAQATLAGVLLAFGLVSCEEHQSVSRRQMVTLETLMEFHASGGLLVERHGLPWPDATPEETVATLRMPEGIASQLRFLPVQPGSGMIGDSHRMVLHFNPLTTPKASTNCRAKKEMKTGTSEDGFTVSVTFCKGEAWLVHAHKKADVDEQDWLAYFLTMQEFFSIMFPENDTGPTLD